MMNLVKIMLAAGFMSKPTVDELLKISEIDKITAAERDEAWKEVQSIRKAEADAASKNTPSHTVTVKKNGFRRLGRAWSGTTTLNEGELSDDELAILEADPMFVVVAL